MQFHRVDCFLMRSECGRFTIESTYDPYGNEMLIIKHDGEIIGYRTKESEAMQCAREHE